MKNTSGTLRTSTILFTGVATVGIITMAATPGSAQVQSPASAPDTQSGAGSTGASSPVTTAAPAPDANANSGIADIIVTAQRRDEKLQDVPIAITAISGKAAAFAGATGTSSLQVAVPALNIGRQTNAALPYIRGIGSSSGDANNEPSVAIYVDGVYQPSAFANLFDFNNIDRVEVLKGPQGTLFGRNATAGVIQIVTLDPKHTPEANVSIGYANYDKVNASAYVSGGLTDNVAANISILYDHQNNAWGRNLTLNRDNPETTDFGARGKLLFTPGDSTKITLEGDYLYTRNPGINGQPPPGAVTLTGQGYPGPFNTLAGTPDTAGANSYGVSLHIDHSFDVFQISSITAYRHTTGFFTYDQDLTILPLVNATMNQIGKMFTQEVHLFSPTASKFQWQLGAFYYNYLAGQVPEDLKGLAFNPTDPTQGIALHNESRSTSVALFAQATYPITDNTNLTGGFRYTWDHVRASLYTTLNTNGPVIDPPGGGKLHPTLSYSKPTWRLSLDHKFGSTILGYLSYNRGIKSGNFGLSAPASAVTSFKPEQLTSYEGGVKTTLFDRKLIFNTSIFYYDFKNIQFAKISNGASLTFNGPSAKSYGAEIEISARPTSRLSINSGASVLHTRIGDFPNAPNVGRLPSGLDDNGDPNFNAGGNRLPYSPKFSGNAGFSYAVPTESGKYTLASNVYYNAGYPTEIDNRLKVNAYTLVNASLSWESSNGHLNFSIWGKNLTNAYYYAQLTAQGGVTDVATGAAPRTYGVTAGFKF